jgi:ankyrin repeat protein
MLRLNKLLLIGFLACIAFVSDGRQWTHAQTGSRENLDTALLDAAKKGNEREVERLLREGVGPDVIETNSLRTPLFYAVQQGQTGMVRLLLDRKADPNLKDRGGMTPLLIAARGTDKTRNEIAQMLIAAKADIDGRSVYGETAMQLAAERGFTDTVLLLLDKGATANAQSAVNTALLKAAGAGKLDEIHQLLNRGANPNAQPIARNASAQTTYRGNTPLIEAVTNGHKNAAVGLMDAKADINIAGFGGRTPLISAVHQGPAFTKLLLDAGAKPNTADDAGRTPIMHVLMSAAGPQDRRQTLLLLIKAGADVNAKDKNGETATRLAVAAGKTDLLPLLGGGGARVDKPTLYNEALVLAERQRLSEIHALLSKGNNPNVADKDGRSPLIIATSFGRLEMISALLQAGSNIDQQDNKGVTALMYAIRARRLDAAQLLLSAGAKTNIKNNAGDTALTMAIPTRNEAFGARSSSVTLEKTAPELVKALLQAGAETSGLSVV